MATAVNIFRPLLVARAFFLPSACSAAGLSVLKQPTCLATAKLTIRGWRRFNRACTKGRSFSALSQRRTRKALAEPRERVPGSPAEPRLLRLGSVSWPASRLAHHQIQVSVTFWMCPGLFNYLSQNRCFLLLRKNKVLL